MPFHMGDESDSESDCKVMPSVPSVLAVPNVPEQGETMMGTFKFGTAEGVALRKARERLAVSVAAGSQGASQGAASVAEDGDRHGRGRGRGCGSGCGHGRASARGKPAAVKSKAKKMTTEKAKTTPKKSKLKSAARPKLTGAAKGKKRKAEPGVNKCFASRVRPAGGKRLQTFNEIEDGYHKLVKSGVPNTTQVSYWNFFKKEMATLPPGTTPQERCQLINEKYKETHPAGRDRCRAVAGAASESANGTVVTAAAFKEGEAEDADAVDAEIGELGGEPGEEKTDSEVDEPDDEPHDEAGEEDKPEETDSEVDVPDEPDDQPDDEGDEPDEHPEPEGEAEKGISTAMKRPAAHPLVD
jgi:hypothetical protein